MRLLPEDMLLMRLRGEVPRTAPAWLRKKSKAQCLHELRALAGQDLGTDPAAWEVWWEEEKERRKGLALTTSPAAGEEKELVRRQLDNAYVDHLVFPEELLLSRLEGVSTPTGNLAWVHGPTADESWAELRRLTGVDFGAEVARWREWWRGQKLGRHLSNTHLLEPYSWTPEELLVLRLKDGVPPEPEFDWLRELAVPECTAELHRRTGLDLGADPAAWITWWDTTRPPPPPRRPLFTEGIKYRRRK